MSQTAYMPHTIQTPETSQMPKTSQMSETTGHSKPVLTKEQLAREMDYHAAVSVMQSLLGRGIITEAESRKIRRKIAAEFPPVWSGIVS